MRAHQDIGFIRNTLFQRALAAQRNGHKPDLLTETQVVRELLDEAHARIRALEKTLERLTTIL